MIAPADHGLGSYDDHHVGPAIPQPSQQDPEGPVGAGELRPFALALNDDELVTQRRILNGEGRLRHEKTAQK